MCTQRPGFHFLGLFLELLVIFVRPGQDQRRISFFLLLYIRRINAENVVHCQAVLFHVTKACTCPLPGFSHVRQGCPSCRWRSRAQIKLRTVVRSEFSATAFFNMQVGLSFYLPYLKPPSRSNSGKHSHPLLNLTSLFL